MDPVSLNVVYGPNEMGKTCLVEWLITSLFRNTRGWNLRDIPRSGKILIEGLEKTPVLMTPRRGKKLEDYWEEGEWGLPVDFSRLLVVKGAELEFGDGREVDRTVIKQFLSHQHFLDTIESRMDKTLHDARIVGGRIEAAKRGQFKGWEELNEKRKRIDELIQRVDQIYSGGDRQRLREKLENLDKELKELEAARCHQAWRTAEKLGKLKRELAGIDEKRLEAIRARMRDLEGREKDCSRFRANRDEAEAGCLHYEWLKTASETCERLLDPPRVRPYFGIVVNGIVLLTSLILLLLGMHLAGIAVLGAGIFLWVLVAVRWPRLVRRLLHQEERSRIEKGFRARFGSVPEDSAQLKSMLKEMEESLSRIRVYEEQLAEAERFVRDEQTAIRSELTILEGREVERKEWPAVVKRHEDRIRDLRDRISQYQTDLKVLQVEEADFRKEPAHAVYSPKKHDELNRERETVRETLEMKNRELDNLKLEIESATYRKNRGGWEEILDDLENTRQALGDRCRNQTADILAKILVHEVIRELRGAEDAKIQRGLSAVEITDMVHALTGRYKTLRLEGSRIFAGDETDEYPLDQLSTGAREQVLLALRVGFSRKLARTPLFLILDDAFQYSDWKRRHRLVKTVLNLARSDWQILYFTMDDHIRDLFEKYGKVLGTGFKSVTLEPA